MPIFTQLATKNFVQRSCRQIYRRDGKKRTYGSTAMMSIWALISATHLSKVLDYVQIGVDEGAQIATGGTQIHPQGLENGILWRPPL